MNLKTVKFTLFFSLVLIFASCEDKNTPLVSVVVKTDTVLIKKDTVKIDTTRLKVDTLKFNFVLLKVGVSFSPNQTSFVCGSPVNLEVQNNVTQDSINRFCYNYYKGAEYYHYTSTVQSKNGDIVFQNYKLKPISVKLPINTDDTIKYKYKIYIRTDVDTNPSIPWLKGNSLSCSYNLKLTKSSIDYIIKTLEKDTTIKMDTLKLSLKIRYNKLALM